MASYDKMHIAIQRSKYMLQPDPKNSSSNVEDKHSMTHLWYLKLIKRAEFIAIMLSCMFYGLLCDSFRQIECHFSALCNLLESCSLLLSGFCFGDGGGILKILNY